MVPESNQKQAETARDISPKKRRANYMKPTFIYTAFPLKVFPRPWRMKGIECKQKMGLNGLRSQRYLKLSKQLEFKEEILENKEPQSR